jgi:radical SAM protein with 4Fe4S-binding SPASM domain
MAAAAREDDRPTLNAVAIELTAVCNQKCAYCYNEWREDGGAAIGAPGRDLVFQRIDRLLEAFTIDHVTLTGGEPFSHRDVFAILEKLRGAGVRVQMISNGGLIDDAIAARLAALKIGYVQITLNGADAATHDEHVGGAGHFERTLRGIRALRAHKVPVVGCVVVTRKNAAHVGAILAIWEELGVKQIALSRFSPAGYAAEATAELLASTSDVETALEQALPYARERGMKIHVTMPIPPCAVETERFAPIGFGTCAVGTSMQELALGPDGKLRNCTLHKTALGGVPDIADPSVDLRALLKSAELVDYKKTLPTFCEGCLHAKTCGGGCGAAAEWVLGSRKLTDPFLWQHVDGDFAAKLEAARAGKRRLEVIR